MALINKALLDSETKDRDREEERKKEKRERMNSSTSPASQSTGKIYNYSFSFSLPWWLSGKESACQCRSHRRHGFNLRAGKTGGGNGNLLQYSGLENPMDRGAWWAMVHRVAKSRTRLSTHALFFHRFFVKEVINILGIGQ